MNSAHILVSLVLSTLADSRYLKIPQARPLEPDVLTVCACEFGDNLWLRLISELLQFAPGGFAKHVFDSKTREWLDTVPCKPWPLPPLNHAVAHATGQGVYFTDYRYGAVTHFLDASLRQDTDYVPHSGLAMRAACLPGRAFLRLLCAHQALLPTAGEPDWDSFGEHINHLQELLHDAAGKGKAKDLGSVRPQGKEGAERGCAARWPWAPIFSGDRLHNMSEYVQGLLSGAVELNMHALAYNEPFLLAPKEHAKINPYLQPCVPLVTECFSKDAPVSCEKCCNPAHPGGKGIEDCFDAVWTFERCCRPLAPDR
mmetsp:Transcript_146703/g.270773  ORF Transcript_146703/g.270773 Transcript_146703/m.270773 type:complete len:313 (+) Transcript_146703:42-980(+)